MYIQSRAVQRLEKLDYRKALPREKSDKSAVT